jgi:hypothetical protein
MHKLTEFKRHTQEDETLKQIQKCKQLSLEFWECLEKHKKIRECGPQYYALSKCIEKLK